MRVEDLLTSAGLDYVVEPDEYVVGTIFRRRRIGAFFYVAGHGRSPGARTAFSAKASHRRSDKPIPGSFPPADWRIAIVNSEERRNYGGQGERQLPRILTRCGRRGGC